MACYFVHSMKNILLEGCGGRPIAADFTSPEAGSACPVLIFCHGFKGFKDWGPFPLMSQRFAELGFVAVKFNFSHNGTTPAHPDQFIDLEAFGQNNFSREQEDLGRVIDWLAGKTTSVEVMPPHNGQIFLVGHSRGGGAAILKAAADERITAVATWASVIEYGRFWTAQEMQKWEKEGVIYVLNGRTGQQMPLYWQLFEDYHKNRTSLHIPTAIRHLTQPLLAVHGTADTVVSPHNPLEMKSLRPAIQTHFISGADHTFGGRHPWTADTIPPDMDEAIKMTAHFFRTLVNF